MFLDNYVKVYSSPQLQTYLVSEFSPAIVCLLLVLVSPLFAIIPSKYRLGIVLFIILLYLMLKTRGSQHMVLSKDRTQLDIYNSDFPSHGRQHKFGHQLFTDVGGAILKRMFGFNSDPRYPEVKRVSVDVFNRMSAHIKIKVFSPDVRFPRRQIIITNHTNSAARDSFAAWTLIPKDSKPLFIQHNFNSLVAGVSRKMWNGWTIDKDDKTPQGKKKLNDELQKIVDYMKRHQDLSVVIYPQGRVPKSTTDCRSVKKMYPGAFYLSLMTGYAITPLINDYSEDGVFTMIVKPPLDLLSEYGSRIVPHDDVGVFRSTPANKVVLDEICDRFITVYQSEYDLITKTENGRADCRKDY